MQNTNCCLCSPPWRWPSSGSKHVEAVNS
jgi:hypothetical protein